MRNQFISIALIGALLVISSPLFSQAIVLDSTQHHLRSGNEREWSEFPARAEGNKIIVHFSSKENPSEQTLSLRQYDVKLNWQVLLNNRALGSLMSDEKDLILYLRIPPGSLKDKNILEIKSNESVSDDILVGPVTLHNRPLTMVLSEGFLQIEVEDKETKSLIPARITITNGEGTLQSVNPFGDDPLAVRPGFIYTGTGKASLGLPAGPYTIYGGRGFEYGVDSFKIDIKAGEHIYKKLSIKREVATPGWISSDTHIHTFTYSRHGDASLRERVLTIAGEGLEMPISTDHNVFVNLKPFALDNGVEKYFTPVTGNEVTTKVGHFNIFPAVTTESVTDHRAENWKSLSANFEQNSAESVIILNHARDVHMDFRPFDPDKHISSAGLRLDDWALPANAMEIINSGSQQTDIMELTRDWFGMLNSGQFLTPVGSSDSHDVSRFIVGQGRTYVRANDSDAGKIDVDEAVRNFRQGKVMVSLGLLTEVIVNDSYGPGDLAPASDKLQVRIKVSGPGWTQAERITLYANGIKMREEKILNGGNAGIKFDETWALPLPKHDLFLVAVAEGPGDNLPFWPIAKPFQPVSPEWQPRVLGLNGAIWFDADKDGKATSASDYAKRLIDDAQDDFGKLIKTLTPYDEAVAVQVAGLLHKSGIDIGSHETLRFLRKASEKTRRGFATVHKEIELSK